MKTFLVRIGGGLLALGLAAAVLAQPEPATAGKAPLASGAVELPGPRPDGSVLLPNQWSLRPVGRQVELGVFPVNLAVHPGGRYAVAVLSGFPRHELVVVDLKAAAVVTRAAIPEAFYGLEFSARGNCLYCSGGSDEVIRVFDFAGGKLSARPDVRLRPKDQRGIPCGLAVARDGRRLYAANVWGQGISVVDLAASRRAALPKPKDQGPSGFGGEMTVDIPLSKAVGPGRTSYEGRKEFDPEVEAIAKRAAEAIDPTSPEAPFPYACRLDERRERLYVSLWAQASVAVIDLKTRQVVALWKVEEHPNEMVLDKAGRRLFVANANRNTVTILDTATGQASETLHAALAPASPPGSTPNSLALTPDERMLFVANGLNNNVAVFDVSRPGRSRSLGFIPVGWYPTSVRVTPDGKRLLVVNAKGLGSRPNPRGPQPGLRGDGTKEDIKNLFPGSLTIIDLPKPPEFAARLAVYTALAYQCTPTGPDAVPQPSRADSARVAGPIPAIPGQPCPLRYVIYVVKENRTYDQILGDVPEGNGDPRLCVFPEKVSPNHHKLAREFVLLDNFYVEAEVSAQGHEWSMGAYCTDFVEKGWPLQYGHNKSGKYPFPAEGHFPIASPANGYLWDRAREAGVSYRSYGEFILPGKTERDPNYALLPALQAHFDPEYRCFDLGYPDVKRAERFISEWRRFEAEGSMPQLQIVRLGNDHTCGTAVGRLTPTAMVADNDVALGKLVDAVTHSRLWPQTAIFVVEDDAQNGPDHVDAHRSVALVISPYTRRGAVDSTMYSTSSLLRTIELILGLQPMSQFDAAARPMYEAFQPTPDLRPYEALPAQVDLNERNSRLAWGSAASAKMDFTREDAADDLLLNEIIWRSVRGADQPMPAPVRAAFVLGPTPDDD